MGTHHTDSGANEHNLGGLQHPAIDFRAPINPLDTIIRSGWQPHFSSSYTVVGSDPKLLEAVYSTAIQWADKKIVAIAGPDAPELVPARPGETTSVTTPLIQASSSLFERSSAAPADTQLPAAAWDLSIHHSDDRSPNRHWRISVGAKTVSDASDGATRVLVSIASSFRDTDYAPLPDPTVPFFRYLSSSLANQAEILSGRTTLLPQAVVLNTPDKIYAFLGALRDETRRHPIVLISKNWGAARIPGDPSYLATPSEVGPMLNGLAQVYFEGPNPVSLGDSNDLTSILENELGAPREYLTWGGAVRVYRPGDALELPATSHRYLVKSDFSGKGEFLEQLRNGVYVLAQHDFTSDPAGPIVSAKDIPFFHQIARLDNLRATTTPAGSTPDASALESERNEWRQLAEDFDLTNTGLRHDLTAVRTENAALREANTELKDTVSSLENTVDALRDEINRLHQQRKTSIEEVKPFDKQTLLSGEAVAAAVRERLSDRLPMTPKFERSLEAFEPNNPELFATIYEALEEMHAKLWHDKYEVGSPNFMKEFNSQSIFDISLTENKLTKEKPGMRQLRLDEFEGRAFEAWAHLKYGNKPGEQFRIHFDFHDDSKQIILSWVGDHMPTAGSGKNGGRRG